MLKNTFVHIPGIGQKTERRLWESGILTWNDWDSGKCASLIRGNPGVIDDHIEASRISLNNRDPRYFSSRMPTGLHWRFFTEFKEETAYLDIETTGLRDWENEITTIALYDGKNIYTYINGENLERFPDEVLRYSVLVTYNGKAFDIPFIERYFGIRISCAHIDLRHILHSLGLKGGLKGCEKTLGIHRGDLDGVDGYFAVLLWQEYLNRQNDRALETLLSYNIADVLSLEILMAKAFNLKLAETPFHRWMEIDVPRMSENPFTADRETIERIRARIEFRELAPY